MLKPGSRSKEYYGAQRLLAAVGALMIAVLLILTMGAGVFSLIGN